MDQLPEVVQKYKDGGMAIIRLTNEDGDFYFKKPGLPEVKMNLDMSISADGQEMKLSDQMLSAVKRLCVYPDKETLDCLINLKPGIFIPMYNEIYKTTGQAEKFTTQEI